MKRTKRSATPAAAAQKPTKAPPSADAIEDARRLLSEGDLGLQRIANYTGLSKSQVFRLKHKPPSDADVTGTCWYCGAGNRPVVNDPGMPGGVSACKQCSFTRLSVGVDGLREALAWQSTDWPYFTPQQRKWLAEQGMCPPRYRFHGEGRSG